MASRDRDQPPARPASCRQCVVIELGTRDIVGHRIKTKIAARILRQPAPRASLAQDAARAGETAYNVNPSFRASRHSWTSTTKSGSPSPPSSVAKRGPVYFDEFHSAPPRFASLSMCP